MKKGTDEIADPHGQASPHTSPSDMNPHHTIKNAEGNVVGHAYPDGSVKELSVDRPGQQDGEPTSRGLNWMSGGHAQPPNTGEAVAGGDTVAHEPPNDARETFGSLLRRDAAPTIPSETPVDDAEREPTASWPDEKPAALEIAGLTDSKPEGPSVEATSTPTTESNVGSTPESGGESASTSGPSSAPGGSPSSSSGDQGGGDGSK